MSNKVAPTLLLDENVIGVWHFEFDGGNFMATLSKRAKRRNATGFKVPLLQG